MTLPPYAHLQTIRNFSMMKRVTQEGQNVLEMFEHTLRVINSEKPVSHRGHRAHGERQNLPVFSEPVREKLLKLHVLTPCTFTVGQIGKNFTSIILTVTIIHDIILTQENNIEVRNEQQNNRSFDQSHPS